MLSRKERRELERLIADLIDGTLTRSGPRILEIVERDPRKYQAALDELLTALSDDMRGKIQPAMVDGLLRSADELLGRLGIDYETERLGSRAERWARQYTYDLVTGIEDTTRDRIGRAVGEYFQDGTLDLRGLGARLDTIVGPGRGQRIAITEATRASAQGERQLVKELNAENPDLQFAEVWQTSRDEMVCPVCGGLQGVRREKAGFVHPDGTTYDAPPAHPNCRCAVRTVLIGGV